MVKHISHNRNNNNYCKDLFWTIKRAGMFFVRENHSQNGILEI